MPNVQKRPRPSKNLVDLTSESEQEVDDGGSDYAPPPAQSTPSLAPEDDDDEYFALISDDEVMRLVKARESSLKASTSMSSLGSVSAEKKRKHKKKKVDDKGGDGGVVGDIEDFVARDHGQGYHSVEGVASAQKDLLDWFGDTREKRGMPWRKPYDPSLTIEEKGQRAYEIWVSEVMLQQTQVSTVIAYWQRWVEKWPTIAELAKADLEEVNAAWRGLGYYRRAKALLSGAKTVMDNPEYNGRLPDDPAVLEANVDGIGRYTAGAICSMAYGVRTPIVDGNIHRLFTRLFAVHGVQTAPKTIKFLWEAATKLVDRLPDETGIAGDWNQGLMELGSQICKPVNPDCGACPLKTVCKAYAELSTPPVFTNGSKRCDLCEPIPKAAGKDNIPAVTVFPMKKEKKASREEEEVVCVVEWRSEFDPNKRRWLFVKRPAKGLLAGLFEPPTTPVASGSTSTEHTSASHATIRDLLNIDQNYLEKFTESTKIIASIPHIFSHINMTYHIQHLILSFKDVSTQDPPPISNTEREVVWLNEEEVESANVGTGVKKVWAEVYGSWGSFNTSSKSKSIGKGNKKAKQVGMGGKHIASEDGLDKRKAEKDLAGEKKIRKIMMPLMP